MSGYTELYLAESRETLAAATDALLALEREPGARAHIDALFRAFHTLKGMSAAMGHEAIARLAHDVESVLEEVRAGRRRASSGLVDALLAARDAIERGIEAALAGAPAPGDVEEALARVRAAAASASERPPARVRVALEPDTPLPGVRAALLLARARERLTIRGVEPDESAFASPAFDGALTVIVDDAPDDAAIERAVRAAGFVASVAIVRDAAAPSGAPDVRRAPGAVAPGATAPAIARRLAARDAQGGEAKATRHVRVSLARLDTLTNLMGELVVARGRLSAISSRLGDAALDDAVGEVGRLIADLHDGVMRSRMVPVWQVFERFPRLVRDTARSVGREVELEVGGQDIELDRSMLDELGEPVVHLLRNAVDHGIEPPDERERMGKPRAGRITLSASRERSSVIVRVRDDGRGIDREAVLARARASGLVDAERREVSDEELTGLIARPGFTTSERVSAVSGRGVGIDAVQSRVRALGGSLEIRSTSGEGTCVTLRLPASLAIVRSVLVRAGDETYVLPVSHVTEALRATPELIRRAGGRDVVVLREELLPLVALRDVVGLPACDLEGQRIVVLEVGERRGALLVDALVGQEDVVVKPVDVVRGAAACFGGATILGDGRPALILDVSTLFSERA